MFCVVLDESGQDDGAAKTNPSLTREIDLVVNISDLDNILDEDDEDPGVKYVIFDFDLNWNKQTTNKTPNIILENKQFFS